jgi:hypothetical protein
VVLKFNTLRKITQGLAFALLIIIPILESYKRLIAYLPPEYLGSLWQAADWLTTSAPKEFSGGYLSWLVIALDFAFGNITTNVPFLSQILANFGGSYWSVTIGGINFIDPLAFLQVLAANKSVTLAFTISALLTISLGLILGRVYCSWLCPINTLLEFNHFILQKLHLPKLKSNLISARKLRYLPLLAGIGLAFLGFTIFPYILPYALLGRFVYYLSIGSVFWTGLMVIIGIILLDVFVQKGLWCNYLCPSGALFSILGRCVLTPEIFEILKITDYGAGGELQLTDAMRTLARRDGMIGVDFTGKRYDMGNKLGILQANIEVGLKHKEIGNDLKEYIKQLANTLD